jgi:hypothetical protein
VVVTFASSFMTIETVQTVTNVQLIDKHRSHLLRRVGSFDEVRVGAEILSTATD